MTKRKHEANAKSYKVNIKLYNYWLDKIAKQITGENLSDYLFTLAIVGLKCDVGYTKLVEDAQRVVDEFKAVGKVSEFSKEDLLEAVSVYFDETSVHAKISFLYEMNGLQYVPAPKKPTPMKDEYYRQREAEAAAHGEKYVKEKFSRSESFKKFAMRKGIEALKRARIENPDIYKNNGRKSLIGKVEEWHQRNPYGTPKKCAAETGIANKTAGKYYKELGYPERSEDIIRAFRKDNPAAKPKECKNVTGLSAATVYANWKEAAPDDRDQSGADKG